LWGRRGSDFLHAEVTIQRYNTTPRKSAWQNIMISYLSHDILSHCHKFTAKYDIDQSILSSKTMAMMYLFFLIAQSLFDTLKSLR